MKKKKIIGTVLATSMLLSLSGQSAMAGFFSPSITVDSGTQYQTMDGFGCSIAGYAEDLYPLDEAVREEIMDLLFTEQGIDLDILRNKIFDDYSAAPGEFDYNVHDGQDWFMQAARDRGVDKQIATAWSPPAYMKTNNSANNGGKLKPEYYDEFAKMIAGFIQYYESLGIDLYAVSPANEPNGLGMIVWDSCDWTADEMKTFYRDHLIPVLEEYNVADTKVMGSEYSWWGGNYNIKLPFGILDGSVGDKITQSLLSDPLTRDRVDIVATHNYPIPLSQADLGSIHLDDYYVRVKPFEQATQYNKPTWMTENCGAGVHDHGDSGMESALFFARDIQDCITNGNVSAYLYWLGAVPGASDEGLIWAHKSDGEFTGEYTDTKRLWVMGNYSKFVKPGFVRVKSTTSWTSDIVTSAYTNPEDGSIVVVAANSGYKDQSINLKAPGSTSLTSYTTTVEKSLEQGDIQESANGNFTVSIPQRSVVTFVMTPAGTMTASYYAVN